MDRLFVEADESERNLGRGDETKNGPTIESVSTTRARLRALGSRPGPGAVEKAQEMIDHINAVLAEQIEGVYQAEAPPRANLAAWREAKEKELKRAAAMAKRPYEGIIAFDKLFQDYEDKLEKEELALDGRPTKATLTPVDNEDGSNGEAAGLLQDALDNERETLNLSNHKLLHIPEMFGQIVTLVSLDLSDNLLQELPDSVAGLVNLESLRLRSNQLRTLPDSIGLLTKLKYLDVSSNSIRRLPESLGRCSSLVELNASFNQLEYLSSNFGMQLVSLEKLDLHLNKFIHVPSSICDLKSLKVLDLHMNKLRDLPSAIGNLSRLEYLDVSSNFNDLVALPESVGDLISLRHFNLSFNQVRELPDSMGRLENLKQLNLDGNPMGIPPMEVAEKSVEDVMAYMKERWRRSIDIPQQVSRDGDTASQAGSDGSSWIRSFSPVSVGSWFKGLRVDDKRKNDLLDQQLALKGGGRVGIVSSMRCDSWGHLHSI